MVTKTSPIKSDKVDQEVQQGVLNPHAKFKDEKYLFEQYKIAISLFQSALDQEEKTNQFFSTANTILVMLLGILFRPDTVQFGESFGIFFLAFIGIFMCLRWRASIRYLENVSEKKGYTAAQIELLFPVFILNIEKRGTTRSFLKGFLYKNVYYSFMLMYLILIFYKAWEILRLATSQ
jgi:hypothetical protein